MTPAPPTNSEALREALAELRKSVRDCIGETIPLRRRWVSAIMVRVVEPLLARAESATAQAERTAGELAVAEARIAALEAALKPFCFGDPTLENILYGDMPDDATCTFTIKLRDTRRARATLSHGASSVQAR